MILWAPKGLCHFSSSALYSIHSLSPRLKLAPLHSCCGALWWPSHSADISKMMQSLQLGCTFTNTLSWALFRDCDPATQCQVSASQPWDLTSTEAAPSLWPLLPSYGAKAQMLTLTSSRLQNQYHLNDSYSFTTVPSMRYSLSPLWTRASVC